MAECFIDDDRAFGLLQEQEVVIVDTPAAPLGGSSGLTLSADIGKQLEQRGGLTGLSRSPSAGLSNLLLLFRLDDLVHLPEQRGGFSGLSTLGELSQSNELLLLLLLLDDKVHLPKLHGLLGLSAATDVTPRVILAMILFLFVLWKVYRLLCFVQ